jgi:hypothetical protein
MMLFRFRFQHGYNLPTLPMILYAYIQYNITIHNVCPFLTIYHRLGMLPQILQQSSSTGWYNINMEFANESNICEEWPFLDKGILINHHNPSYTYYIYIFIYVCVSFSLQSTSFIAESISTIALSHTIIYYSRFAWFMFPISDIPITWLVTGSCNFNWCWWSIPLER